MFSRLMSHVGVVATALCTIAAGSFVKSAQAQVVITLTPSFASGAPGSTVTYQATIQNQSTTQSVYFNNFVGTFNSVNGDPNDVIDSVDDFSFLGYFQAQYADRRLPANTTYSGNLVDVLIRANAPQGAMDAGTFTISGGATDTEVNALTQLGFTITSAAVIPEMPSSGLLGYGAVALVGIVVARRRNR